MHSSVSAPRSEVTSSVCKMPHRGFDLVYQFNGEIAGFSSVDDAVVESSCDIGNFPDLD